MSFTMPPSSSMLPSNTSAPEVNVDMINILFNPLQELERCDIQNLRCEGTKPSDRRFHGRERERNSGRKKRVRFFPTVEVSYIPSHRDYSESDRKKLWSSLDEIRCNVKRNSFEYGYDQCDWQKASEEQDMYRCEATGDLLHPAYIQHALHLHATRQLCADEKQKMVNDYCNSEEARRSRLLVEKEEANMLSHTYRNSMKRKRSQQPAIAEKI